jgi:hypothetical protein
MNERLDYLIECAKTAREELIFRIKHRDTWLKLQLYTQAILWALSKGIKLGGAESTSFPDGLALAFPISLVFTCLYSVEDHLISGLSNYIGSLSQQEKKITNSEVQIYSWDNSKQLIGYAKGFPLILRWIAQIAGFLILPTYLVFFYFQSTGTFKWEVYFQIALFVTIFSILLKGYKKRKKTGS